MQHLDLFSGIGGFALAARWAGIETIAFCEVDRFCQQVLAKQFPGVAIHQDIRAMDGGQFLGVDLVTGGYPCQPFSVAGNRRGKHDYRHLWPEMFRIIQQARPTWVIGENVKGHITLGLDTVLDDLEGEGYATRTFCIPACAVGAVHRRERLFILAHSTSNGWDESPTTCCHVSSDDQRWAQKPQENCQHEGCGSLRFDMDRFPATVGGWGAEPPSLRVDDGLPYRVDRNRALGNAVVPQVVYPLLRAIQALQK